MTITIESLQQRITVLQEQRAESLRMAQSIMHNARQQQEKLLAEANTAHGAIRELASLIEQLEPKTGEATPEGDSLSDLVDDVASGLQGLEGESVDIVEDDPGRPVIPHRSGGGTPDPAWMEEQAAEIVAAHKEDGPPRPSGPLDHTPVG